MAKIRLAPGLKPRGEGGGATRPHLLLATAVAYVRAAKLALDDDPDKMILPAYMLAGFSIEFSLKAFILQKTGDIDLTTGFGHKLRPAWAKATELGFDVADMNIRPDDFSWLIDAFADHHDSMTFRYLPDVKPFKMTITPQDLVTGAGAFVAAAAREISIKRIVDEASG